MRNFISTPEVTQGAVQALLELRRGARRIEEGMEAILPLSRNQTATDLEAVRAHANKISTILKKVFEENVALLTFGEQDANNDGLPDKGPSS